MSYLHMSGLQPQAGEAGTTEETVNHLGHWHVSRSRCGRSFFFISVLPLRHQLEELLEGVFALPPSLLLPEEHRQIAGEEIS